MRLWWVRGRGGGTPNFIFKLKEDKIQKVTEQENTGAEKNKLFPTDLGLVVTDFLSQHFEKVKFSIGPFFSKRRVSFCCYRFNLVCYQLRDLVATFILALIVGFDRRWCIGCHL